MTDEVYEYQQSMQEQAKAAHRTPISPTRTASEAENHKKDGPCQTLVSVLKGTYKVSLTLEEVNP